jgi:hypothetical protein
MSTPLQVYDAAVKFLQASARLQPDRVLSAAVTQSDRVIATLGKLTFDQTEATELLEKLCEDDPNCHFTADQKASISDVLISGVDGDHKEATPANRVVNKEQHHEYVFDYFPAILWSVISSKEKMKNKLKQVAHFCIENMQLRNADAQTRRLLVATVHEASNEDKSPEECFDDFLDLTESFRQKRTEIKGSQSMHTFYDDPTKFIRHHPGSYPDDAPPVKCPCSKKNIRTRANKSSIPCRRNNAKLAGKRDTLGRNSSSVVPYGAAEASNGNTDNSMMNSMKLIAGCMQILKGETKQSDNEELLTGLKIFGHGTHGNTNEHQSQASSSMRACEDDVQVTPLVGRKDTLPGCLAKGKAGSSQGNLAALRQQIAGDLGEPMVADRGSDIKEKGRKRKKGDDDDDDNASDADDEDSSDHPSVSKPKVLKKPAAKAVKSKTKVLKRPAAKLDDNAPAADVLKARKSILLFPRALKQLQAMKTKKDRPKAPKKLQNAHYMTGVIYPNYKSPSGNIMRVFARKGDRHEQRIPYNPKDRADAMRAWDLACACIETDPRPVDAA